jgi:hypothetical protein
MFRQEAVFCCETRIQVPAACWQFIRKSGAGVRVRAKPILMLLLFVAMGIGTIMIVEKIRKRIERRWPDMTKAAIDDLRVRREAAWEAPLNGSLELPRGTSLGTIMGSVTAKGWSAAGRIYIQVEGPESPDAAKQADDFVFCEVTYSMGEGEKIEQYMVDRGRIVWQLRGQATGYSAVSSARYRLCRETGRLKLTFWTSEQEPPESVLFHYCEDGQQGLITFRVPVLKSKP